MPSRVLLLFTTCLLSACAYDIHNHMTLEEIKSTFHVDNHDSVPEYDVVHITNHNVRRRSIDRTRDANTLDNKIDLTKLNSYKVWGGKDWGGKSDSGGGRRQKTAHIRLHAFGKPLDLSLVRNEGLFKKSGLKIWTVEPNATAQHGVEYVEIPSETHEDIGEIYQDEENQAAILLRNDEIFGHLLLEGNIGHDLVIKPLPSRLRGLATATKPPHSENNFPEDDTTTASTTMADGPLPADDDEMFLDADGELSAEVAIDTGLPIRRKGSEKMTTQQSAHHIVFRRKEAEEDTDSDYAFMEPDHLAKRYRRSTPQNLTASHSRSKRDAPYTIYPEILVIVDYDGYRLHGGDNLQIKRYFVSFWNGVDLRYKLLKGPKIRISIAGIIISRGRDATPYLERNRVGRDAIDSAAALTDMGKYLFRERRLPVYDIAVAITKLDMCRRSYPSDVCNRGTAGFAYVGGACVVNKRLEKVNSVAIIEDTGGFSGIIVAAHEVGHLLGAVHDGSPPPSYLGGPGAEKCQWTDGYIMSDLRHTERGFRWSSCSVASFHHFLNGDTATCLYNSPHEDDSLPRVLPGKLLTLDAQCRRDRGTSACFKDDRVCAQLFCFDSGSGYCVAYRPAAEGSPCGDGQYCINGRCVAEHENIIPDYSQNTPSYIRRDGQQTNQGRPLFYDEEEEEIIPDPYYQQYTTKSPYYNTETQNPYYNQNYYTTTTKKPYVYTTTQRPYTQYKYTTTTTKRPYYTKTTTKSPYYVKTSTQNPYYTKTTTQNPYYNTQKTTTKYQPFKLFSLSTTKSPYDFQHYAKQSTAFKQYTTKNYYSTTSTTTTTTKKPYTYTTTTAKAITQQTTKNPYIGNYYILRQKTTRNPYDFANFGKNYQTTANYHDNINNNYLKRSYNSASYYSDSSNVKNVSTFG